MIMTKCNVIEHRGFDPIELCHYKILVNLEQNWVVYLPRGVCHLAFTESRSQWKPQANFVKFRVSAIEIEWVRQEQAVKQQ